MSIHEAISVDCPRCGRTGSAETWRSLNATLHREQKAALLDGRLTTFVCAGCGHEAQLIYPILYHDMERRLMIWLVPGGESPASERELLGEGYTFRRVASRERLCEKIAIFDAGLDDVTIEAMKAVLEEQGSAPDASLYFVLREEAEGKDSLVFAVVGAEGAMHGIAVGFEPLYPEMHATFNSSLVGDDWPSVDRAFVDSLAGDRTAN